MALAYKACQAGYSTIYYTTKDLISEMLIIKGIQAYKSKRKSLLTKSLLVLDDFALTPYNADEQAVLFDILNIGMSVRVLSQLHKNPCNVD